MLIFDDPDLTAYYAVPFLIALALPGWLSLVATSLVGAGVAIWGLSSAGDGVGSVIGLILVLTAVGGLFCGVVTRVATLWFASPLRHPFRFAAIAVVGFLAPPTLIAGPSATVQWAMRPSALTCATSTFRVTAAGQTLRLPGAPVFAIGVPPHGAAHYRSFERDRSLREVCGRSLVEGEVIGPVVVYLHPWVLDGSHTEAWKAAACAAPRSRRDDLLCRLTDAANPGRRIERATLYGPELADTVEGGGVYRSEKVLLAALAAGARAASPSQATERVGAFEMHPDGLRIARGPDWATSTGEPFVLACDGDPSRHDRSMVCAASDAFGAGLRGMFTFRTSGAEVEADARGIRSYLNDLVRELASAE